MVEHVGFLTWDRCSFGGPISQHGGAKVLAVATGSDSAEVFADAGADIVLPDLDDTAAFLAAIKQVLAS
ncbi:hypothetical protein FMUAM8_35600 [Nocardia cyriacigeorgica]|nr:hypothetical protein FMUAM8_35600 [Nocardia cyriacigeorgica]